MIRLKLTIVTPEKPIVSDEVDEVTLPGIAGEFGVLPDHTTFLTPLSSGRLSFRKGTEVRGCQISGGFCEVRSNEVSVLADKADSL